MTQKLTAFLAGPLGSSPPAASGGIPPVEVSCQGKPDLSPRGDDVIKKRRELGETSGPHPRHDFIRSLPMILSFSSPSFLLPWSRRHEVSRTGSSCAVSAGTRSTPDTGGATPGPTGRFSSFLMQNASRRSFPRGILDR
ncbi:60S ribosomal protein L24 isoform X2 [Sapajus apella]|uniref:60S ribosomal protein L24 isoform X2 n=1 Tax=Sapajus apella TaxID=9515 RepID=A0A6J3JLX1_SAPAP|nr:60S ribosomal protein L24 isoform X2 [Sapajus apella]